MRLRNIKCTIAYDGTAFHGYQRQGTLRTVQLSLEAATRQVLQEDCLIYASGRTDAGVHATGQVISFQTTSSIPVDRIPYALNSVLPPDVAVQSAELVPPGFHARFSVRHKTYRYRLYLAAQPSPFWRHYAYQVRERLDLEAMQAACGCLPGTHDFSAFRATGSSVKDPIRTILAADFGPNGETTDFTVTADGFLYNMVRILVGTLLEIGRSKLRPGAIADIIESRERERAGPTVSPCGLYLERVEYERWLDTDRALY